MRRNLSDTDVGILDLRKFYYEINNTEVYVYFPFEYLNALGWPYSIDQSGTGSIQNFLKHRFNQVIIWDDGGIEKSICIKTAPETDAHNMALNNNFSIKVYEVADGEVGLVISEI